MNRLRPVRISAAARASLLERLVVTWQGNDDAFARESIDVALEAYIALGLVTDHWVGGYRERLREALENPIEARPPRGLRRQAKRVAQAQAAALSAHPTPREVHQVGSALAALRDVGVLSFEEWSEWLDHLVKQHGPAIVKDLHFGDTFLVSFGAPLEDGELDGLEKLEDQDEFDELDEHGYFKGHTLLRVVPGPVPSSTDITIVAAELYDDGVIIDWHALRSAGEHSTPPVPESPDELTDLRIIRGLHDDVGTAYRRQGGDGPGWDARRPRLMLGASQFCPRVPDAARRLEVDIENETVNLPLT